MKTRSEPKTVTPEQALVKLQAFCAFRERSEQEVRDKLYKWNIAGSEGDKILERLREQGFINEQRFSNAFAGGKFRTRKWGRVKIKAMLSGARVSEGAIRSALGQIPEAEYRKELESLMVRKLSQINDADTYSRKQKLARFALGKGYEAELVWELVNRMIKADTD